MQGELGGMGQAWPKDPAPLTHNIPLFALGNLLEVSPLCLDAPYPAIPPSVPLRGAFSLFEISFPHLPTWKVSADPLNPSLCLP